MAVVIDTEQIDSQLMTVFVTDFDDNYHRLETDPSTELERQVRRLRRRYKNIVEYNNALALYYEYMEKLSTRYGGMNMLKQYIKSEMIDDFIPPKPRMKNTRMNKFLVENKILLSEGRVLKYELDEVEDYIEDLIEDLPKDIKMEIVKDKEGKTVAKIYDESSPIRINKTKITDMTTLDYLEQYFKAKSDQSIGKKMLKKQEDMTKISLTDLVEGNYEHDKPEKDNSIMYYKGQYMNQDSIDQLKTYNMLRENGWNVPRMLRYKSASNVKRVKTLMDEGKKKKKKKKDTFITKMLGDNGYDSFEDFEAEMLDFTSKKFDI